MEQGNKKRTEEEELKEILRNYYFDRLKTIIYKV